MTPPKDQTCDASPKTDTLRTTTLGATAAKSVSSFDVFCQGKCVNEVGHFYQVLVDDVHKMLAPGAIAAMFPDLTGLTPRLAGLGWFQGWNVRGRCPHCASFCARARAHSCRARVLTKMPSLCALLPRRRTDAT